MARKSLRTLGLAYRDFDSIGALPEGWQESPSGLEDELTFYGVLGIKDPLREVGFCGVTFFCTCGQLFCLTSQTYRTFASPLWTFKRQVSLYAWSLAITRSRLLPSPRSAAFFVREESSSRALCSGMFVSAAVFIARIRTQACTITIIFQRHDPCTAG